MIPSQRSEPRRLRILVIALLLSSFVLSFGFYFELFLTITPLFKRLAPQPPIPERPSTLLESVIGMVRISSYQIMALATSADFLRLFLALSLTIVFLNELSYLPLGWLHRYVSERFRTNPLTRYPLVSVIVPAYNEERTIKDTLETLLEANYPNKEIVVVNDGSTDHTGYVVLPYAREGKVQLINRPNGGKAAATNTGLALASGDIVVLIDADGAVERQALTWLVSHFQQPDVIAVSGSPKVGNRDTNLLTRLQALEYVRGINLRRRAFDLLNTMECIPGSIGAFRRGVTIDVGRYDRDTVVEDMDLTVRLIKTRGLVRQENRAIAYTEAPETLRDFIRQRLRWYGGGLQVVLKHRFFWWRFGAFSFLGYPYMVAGMTLVPVFELLLVALSIVQILAGMWLFQLLYWSAIAIVDVLFSVSAVLLDREDWRLILCSPIYALFYRPFNDIIRLKSYWNLARGRLLWQRTRAERQGGLTSRIRI